MSVEPTRAPDTTSKSRVPSERHSGSRAADAGVPESRGPRPAAGQRAGAGQRTGAGSRVAPGSSARSAADLLAVSEFLASARELVLELREASCRVKPDFMAEEQAECAVLIGELDDLLCSAGEILERHTH
ncbi:hypothetical protein [Brevibacterium samyangense]|uniref:Uncharacterized protein n=1 Tax=Brevibacterium samyangense TaxID=366888 RepID=A0ABN2TB83_9MICO